MSFLNPSTGEVLDRLGIVQRRFVERKLAGLEFQPVEEEASELAAQINGHFGQAGTSLLFAVNAALWERENLLRKLGASDTELAALVKETSALNDWRARLIASIDGLPSSPKIHRS